MWISPKHLENIFYEHFEVFWWSSNVTSKLTSLYLSLIISSSFCFVNLLHRPGVWHFDIWQIISLMSDLMSELVSELMSEQIFECALHIPPSPVPTYPPQYYSKTEVEVSPLSTHFRCPRPLIPFTYTTWSPSPQSAPHPYSLIQYHPNNITAIRNNTKSDKCHLGDMSTGKSPWSGCEIEFKETETSSFCRWIDLFLRVCSRGSFNLHPLRWLQ